MPVKPVTSPETLAEAYEISRENRERLITYEALLQRWNAVQDLVAPSTLADAWQRHFADSAQLLALAPAEVDNWVDLGSGAGFPGLVVAILLPPRPNLRVHLIESNGRKCAFLRDVARATRAPVEIHDQRIESVTNQATLRNVSVVSARALAPLDKLITLAEPFFGPKTVGLFLKGRDAAAEIDEARRKRAFDCEAHPSLTDAEGRVVEIIRLGALQGDVPGGIALGKGTQR